MQFLSSKEVRIDPEIVKIEPEKSSKYFTFCLGGRQERDVKRTSAFAQRHQVQILQGRSLEFKMSAQGPAPGQDCERAGCCGQGRTGCCWSWRCLQATVHARWSLVFISGWQEARLQIIHEQG
jgi:hypothetical protein